MRSCAYCGKNLEPGEVCDCPQSVARRQKSGGSSQQNTSNETSGSEKQSSYNPYENNTTYRTGYTQEESRVKRAWNRYRMKRDTEKTTKTRSGDGFFKRLLSLVVSTMRSPVDSVMNPPHVGRITILLIAAVMGAVLRMCVYFAVTGLSRSPFGLLAAIMSFGGRAGYKIIADGMVTALMGAVSGSVLFILYSGIFWFINRMVIRSRIGFWEFSERMIVTCIPMTVIGLVGLLLAMLSTSTLIILAGCGVLSTAVLTYEALRTEWINRSPGKTMYLMMLGMFVFISIIYSLLIIGRGI